jgi:hypothetical protein
VTRSTVRRLGFLLLATLALAGCGRDGPPAPTATGTAPAQGLGSLAQSGAGHEFFEIYEPDRPPRGTMLLIHGGGWDDKPGDARNGLLGAALAYRAQGWRVVNVAYSSATATPNQPDPMPMMRDVVAFYDQIRRAFPGPVCASGPSAGGHLAAMLAVLRPRLTCAVIDAGPVDLIALHDEHAQALTFADQAFGVDDAVLARWSPARLWRRGGHHPAVFAAYAHGDPYVPAGQGRALRRADPRAVVHLLPEARAGAANAAGFIHSDVTRSARVSVAAAEERFLAKVVPLTHRTPAPRRLSATRSCDAAVPRANWSSARRRDRWRLLRAGVAWTATQTTGGLLAATIGCSGSGASQDDGLSVWAPPVKGQRAGAGTSAALTFSRGGRALHSVAFSVRGFLARPADWNVGLYAGSTPIAACTAGRCRGLRLVHAHDGALVAGSGSGNPDAVNEPPTQRVTLPAGTTSVALRLTCVHLGGCSLAGVSRRRDPVGHPAILSIYAAVVR